MSHPNSSKTGIVVAAVATLSLLATAPVYAAFWDSDERADLSFQGAFPKRFYESGHFGWVILGTTIVAAAAITFATAAAGAPVAATGVSTVASVIGGGGVGSYMAGMSVIGGWVGGNAMVGAAILNGISLGLGGGGAAFATLSAVGKVAVLSSVTATALDGVLIFYNQDTKELAYRVRTAVPTKIGSKDIKNLAEKVQENAEKILVASNEKNKEDWDAANKARNTLIEEAVKRGEEALQKGASPEDLLVLGMLNKNAEKTNLGNRLINKISGAELSQAGYLTYVRAVIEIENGRLNKSKELLKEARQSDPYAIEPTLLLVPLLGQDFMKNEKLILNIVKESTAKFDDDKYQTSYGLFALRYRMASMYFRVEAYDRAQTWYEAADKTIPITAKYNPFGDKQVRNLVRLGIANSIYKQGQSDKANALVKEILGDAKSDEEIENLRVQYVGHQK